MKRLLSAVLLVVGALSLAWGVAGAQGANEPGPYDPTPSRGDNQGNGNAPCNGCVGSADDKNPPGQLPGGNDPNNGYECDDNRGVGNDGGNPAHTGCAPTGRIVTTTTIAGNTTTTIAGNTTTTIAGNTTTTVSGSTTTTTTGGSTPTTTRPGGGRVEVESELLTAPPPELAFVAEPEPPAPVPASAEAQVQPPPAGELAFTGSNLNLLLALAGLACVLSGLMLTRIGGSVTERLDRGPGNA